MGYTVHHTIDADVDSFWQLFFDQDLARAMLRDFGNAATFEVVEDRVDSEGTRHRRIECTSNVELPDFVKKLVGDGSYTESGRYDSALKRYTAQCVPKLGADKFQTHFEITAEPVGDGTRCQRQLVVENTVKVFAIGSMLERLLERTQREAHAKAAEFINGWIRSRGLGKS